MSNTIYCTYLTIYKGNKLPPFYIGSTAKSKENNPSFGTKWFHNPETSEVIRINPSQDPTPSNFIPGRGFKINK